MIRNRCIAVALVLLLQGGLLQVCAAQAKRADDKSAPKPTARYVLVKVQCLELVRSGNPSIVKQFRVTPSPAFVLNDLTTTKVRIQAGAPEPRQLVGRLKIGAEGVLSVTLTDRTDPSKVVYEVSPRENVKVGGTIVVSGELVSGEGGTDIERFVQFSFEEAKRDKKPAQPAKDAPTAPTTPPAK